LKKLEEAKERYQRHSIVCHNDADGICSALLASEFFKPNKFIIIRENYELGTKLGQITHQENVLYLYVDMQPPENGKNIFCIDHHKIKDSETLTKGQFFIKSIPENLPDANVVLSSFLKAVQLDNYNNSLEDFLISFRTDKTLRMKLAGCGAIGDNANQLYEPNSALLKFLEHFSDNEIENLRSASLAFTFEMSESYGFRGESSSHLMSKLPISFNEDFSEFFTRDYLKMGETMDAFNQKLRKETEGFLPRNVLIIFSEYQKDQNDLMMTHVKGIVANYFLGAKKLLILEKLSNGVNFSARNLSEKGFLKILQKLFDSFSVEIDVSGKGKPKKMRKQYGWKPKKKEGGGYIFDPQPYIEKDYFTEKAPAYLSKNNWMIVTVSGQVLLGEAEISVQPFME
jgi:hypothetical protein|tara:strand:- start:9716 stop:10912 length:1197 start_codon:yes stop_codon:yes gene_type:complete